MAIAKEPVGKKPQRYKLVEPGTIFYNPMRILLGSIAMIDDGQEPAITSPDYVVFRPREGLIHHRWLYYWLRSSFGSAFIKSVARGAVRERLLFRRLAAEEIMVPPFEAQRRFAEAVAVVERARAAAEAKLEVAAELEVAYLARQFETIRVSTQANKRLAEITETCSGSTPDRSRPDYFGGSVPWVKTAELRDERINETEERVTRKALTECSLRLLPPGTLLIAMYGQGQTRGRTGLLSVEATTNQACFAVLPNPKEFESEYLQLWFRSNYSTLRTESDGRGGSQPNLNGQLLRQQIVPLPPLPEQRKIVADLSAQLSFASSLNQQIESELCALNALPVALLRRAFNEEA